jgi:hypothetical protein
MTTKKLVIVIVSIVAALVLLVAIFVGAIVGLTFYSIGKSEAAGTAKAFLQKSEKLKQETGEVRDFGSFITGSINSHNSDGEATLYVKVIGERKTVNARVDLMINATYENERGETVKLLDPYEPVAPEP